MPQIITDPEDFKNNWFMVFKISIPLNGNILSCKDTINSQMNNLKKELRTFVGNATRVFGSASEFSSWRYVIFLQPIEKNGLQATIRSWGSELSNRITIRCDVYSSEDRDIEGINKILFSNVFRALKSLSLGKDSTSEVISSVPQRYIDEQLQSSGSEMISFIKEHLPEEYKKKIKVDLAEEILEM